jgi:hypothetical protein
MKPIQVGFFTHLTIRINQTSLYDYRLQLATNSPCPPFFLQAAYVNTTCTNTKVWNVYAHTDESEHVAAEFKLAYNTTDFQLFYTWKEYNSLKRAIDKVSSKFKTGS